MSTDDIVFEDVTYREPRRVRRPDRDRRWACLAYELPGSNDLPIFLDRKPADAVERHALRDTSVELGGILLGQECVDDQTGEPFVWITEAIEAKHYENTQASFTYTHDSWEEITRERDRLHPDLDIVGWYHTHPDFGVFLSSHDLFIHHNFFSQPLQVAYVVDPIRQTRGFFRWRDGVMEAVGGFHLSADRGDRAALARLVNDLEDYPNTEGGGGGLSPRLEAELIAMLTRQHQPTAVAPAQSAAAFTLLGLVLGALAVVGALWLQSVTGHLNEQTLLLKDLDRNLAQATKSRETDVDLARIRASEEVLDKLLREVNVGAAPGRFLERYTQAVQERDKARGEAAQLATEKAALSDFDTKLRAEQAQRDRALSELRKEADRLAKAGKEDTAEINRLKDALESQKKLLDDSSAGALLRRYDIAWYVAAGALGLCVVLALGLVAALARSGPALDTPGEPPHAIT